MIKEINNSDERSILTPSPNLSKADNSRKLGKSLSIVEPLFQSRVSDRNSNILIRQLSNSEID